MATKTSKPRPKNLDLRTIKLPLPGVVSILHRLSGALLFLLGIPLLLVALQGSLSTREGFESLVSALTHPVGKLVLLGLAWAFLHHFCAGIRFLLLDIHKGVELGAARFSSGVVMGVSLILTLIAGVLLW